MPNVSRLESVRRGFQNEKMGSFFIGSRKPLWRKDLEPIDF